jgi:N-acetylglucosamine-6-phosphate deacetylase
MSILFTGARKVDADGRVNDFWMRFDGSTISETGAGTPPTSVSDGASQHIDVDGNWLLPGFVDLHGHGGGGFSYDDGRDAILQGLAVHRTHGTTRNLVSLVANPLDQLQLSLGLIADLAAEDPLILGSHLEGPFLSLHRRGGHNSVFLRHPDVGAVRGLLEAARGTLRMVTLAPELPGALDVIDVFAGAGVTVGLGHTDADFDLAREAFAHGARVLTHTYNAMPGIHHRQPGPVVAAFEDPRIYLELILDGHHVHPDVATMTFQSAPGRIALVTDSMAAAGATDGDYRLGSLNVAVRGGIALLRGTTTIAGSTLTQDHALRVAMDSAHVTIPQAVEALTLTPAKVLGLQHRHGMLAPGFAADAVILTEQWDVLEVWADGRQLPGPADAS